MSMPTPPEEKETAALVHLPPKRPRSTTPTSPQSQQGTVIKRQKHNCPFNLPDCNGCQPHDHDDKRQPPSKQDRAHDAAIFWRTMASISHLPPNKAHMIQLQQAFLNSYFSPSILASHNAYFRIFYWDTPSSAALSAARDALCLIHIGSRKKDPRLLHEGQRRNIAAITCLRQDLARNLEAAIVDDAVLAANYTLGQAEVFLAVSHPNSQYVTHMSGLLMLLVRRGPGSIRSPFARALLYNIRPVSVMHGLLGRKGMFLAECEWRDAARLGWDGRETLAVEITDLSLMVPGLLERADGLARRKSEGDGRGKGRGKGKTMEAEVVDLLTELSKLELGLQNWILKFYRATNATASPYRLRSISHYPLLLTASGTLSHVFPSMFEFPAFLSATTHVWLWTTLLVIRQTILDVASLHPYPIVRAQNQNATLAASVDECAMNLCQTIGFLVNPAHASNGLLACSPALYFSERWFDRQGQSERVAWTMGVRQFLETDARGGGKNDTTINVSRPMFVWWMLPDIPVERAEVARDGGKVVEDDADSNG